MNDIAKSQNAGGIKHVLCEKSFGVVNWVKTMLVGQCQDIIFVLARLQPMA